MTTIAALTAIEPKTPIQPSMTCSYTSGGMDLAIDVFQPGDHQAGDRRPGIVFFFGGGWKSGTITQFHRQASWLAHRGIVACCADYRVAERQGTTPFDAVDDARIAISTVRAQAEELGIDPKRLAAGGGSAGGHIAAMSVMADEAVCRPDALVLFNPVLDTGPDGYAHDRVGPDWQRISPVDLADAPWPPTAVLLGDQDRIIPVPTAERFRAKLSAAEARCDVFIHAGFGHGFFNQDRFSETLSEMDAFLTAIAWLTPQD